MSKVVSELIFTENDLEVSFVNKIKPTHKIDYSKLYVEIEKDKISISENNNFIGKAYLEKFLSNQDWNALIEEFNAILSIRLP